MPKLANRKRERFAIEIAASTPFEEAYVVAGFKQSPWSYHNARKLAQHPDVARRIAELQDELRERSLIKAEYVQAQILPLVEANPRDLFEVVVNGEGKKVDRLRSISNLPRRLAAAISRVKFDDHGVVREITLHDKISAGTTLLRSIGALIDRLKISDDFEQMNDDELATWLRGALCDLLPDSAREIKARKDPTTILIEDRVKP